LFWHLNAFLIKYFHLANMKALMGHGAAVGPMFAGHLNGLDRTSEVSAGLDGTSGKASTGLTGTSGVGLALAGLEWDQR